MLPKTNSKKSERANGKTDSKKNDPNIACCEIDDASRTWTLGVVHPGAELQTMSAMLISYAIRVSGFKGIKSMKIATQLLHFVIVCPFSHFWQSKLFVSCLKFYSCSPFCHSSPAGLRASLLQPPGPGKTSLITGCLESRITMNQWISSSAKVRKEGDVMTWKFVHDLPTKELSKWLASNLAIWLAFSSEQMLTQRQSWPRSIAPHYTIPINFPTVLCTTDS